MISPDPSAGTSRPPRENAGHIHNPEATCLSLSFFTIIPDFPDILKRNLVPVRKNHSAPALVYPSEIPPKLPVGSALFPIIRAEKDNRYLRLFPDLLRKDLHRPVQDLCLLSVRLPSLFCDPGGLLHRIPVSCQSCKRRELRRPVPCRHPRPGGRYMVGKIDNIVIPPGIPKIILHNIPLPFMLYGRRSADSGHAPLRLLPDSFLSRSEA